MFALANNALDAAVTMLPHAPLRAAHTNGLRSTISSTGTFRLHMRHGREALLKVLCSQMSQSRTLSDFFSPQIRRTDEARQL